MQGTLAEMTETYCMYLDLVSSPPKYVDLVLHISVWLVLFTNNYQQFQAKFIIFIKVFLLLVSHLRLSQRKDDSDEG